MKVLFLSLSDFGSFDEQHIYSDILREFIKAGHTVYCVSPVEKRQNQPTSLIESGENRILKLKIGDTQKVNFIKKGINTMRIEGLFLRGIKRYFKGVKFDLVLYPTPPVTFAKVIRFIKKRDGAKAYLMLKDIFPQNAVDLGILKKSGLKGIIYKYFRKKEKRLYALSDYIGCMSKANCDYLLAHNPDIPAEKVEVCANSVDPVDRRISPEKRLAVREKYGLPTEKTLFVYGGNLGRPQDVPFIVECLKECEGLENAHFLVAGSGTDRPFLEEHAQTKPKNFTLFSQLPKTEYDEMIACCDVGLIFLDHRFTIPNFPSRLLAYMQAGLPTLCCTDLRTDVGRVCVEGGFGWSCESVDPKAFRGEIERIMQADIPRCGEKAWEYLLAHYTAEIAYRTIVGHFEENGK